MEPPVTDFPSRTDVLVVGAGPTGLSLACRLARRGIDHVVVDHAPAGANISNGAVIQARTLEVLESIDVSDALVSRGVPVPHFAMKEGDENLFTVYFSELPTRYPFALMMPQTAAEAILLEQLTFYGSSVLRPVTAVGLQQDEQGVTVELWDGSTRSGSPARRSIVAKYVVGCDGMHSQIRSALDMAFIGSSPGATFVAADVQLDWSLPRTEVQLFFSDQGLMLVAPQPDELHRILALVEHGDTKPSRGQLQELITTRGPKASPGVVREVVWSARYNIHDRVVAHYRSGRVFLAGDAAHVHSPAAGQGMNAGVQDAINLADKLCEVICGRAPASLLDRYEDERRPIAAAFLGVTERMTRMATLRGLGARKLRNGILHAMSSFPAVGRRLALRLSGLEGSIAKARSGARENKLLYVATLLFVALLLGTTFAAWELPQKMSADSALWLTFQRSLYPFFSYVGGPIECAALVSSGLLAVKRQRAHRGYAVAVAVVCLFVAFAIWVAFIQPVNAEIAELGTGVAPYQWATLRSQWECSHLSRFVLHLCGFLLLASAKP